VYGLLRQGEVTSIGKPIVFSPLAAVGTGLLVACGAFLFLASRSRTGRLMGLMTATLVGWMGGAFTLAVAGYANAVIAKAADLDSGVYALEWHAFILPGLECGILLLVFSAVRRVLAGSNLHR
jgi:hypothetical protein